MDVRLPGRDHPHDLNIRLSLTPTGIAVFVAHGVRARATRGTDWWGGGGV